MSVSGNNPFGDAVQAGLLVCLTCSMKSIRPEMNFCLLPDVLVMSLKAVLVAPGSVNDQPPTEIQASNPALFFFSAVNRL